MRVFCPKNELADSNLLAKPVIWNGWVTLKSLCEFHQKAVELEDNKNRTTCNKNFHVVLCC